MNSPSLSQPLSQLFSPSSARFLILRSLPYCLVLMGLAIDFSGLGNNSKAYSQSLTCDIGSLPVHPGNYKLRGSLYLKKEQFVEALDCFEIALRDARGQQDPELWNNRGLALAGLKEYSEAIASYDMALKIKPGASFVDRVKPLVKREDYYLWWFNRGTALVDLQRYQEALDSLDRSLQIRSDYGFVWFYRGLALFRLERYEEARRSYRRSVLLSPNTPYNLKFRPLFSIQDYVVYYGEAEAKSRLGRYKEAIKAFERGKSIRLSNPEMKVFQNNIDENSYESYIEGIRLMDRAEYAKALAIFDRIIANNPKYANAWDARADALTLLKSYPAAIQAYDRVIALEPDDYASWYKKGNALRKAKRDADALQAYQQAINLSGGFAEAWHNRGLIFYGQGKYNEAIASYNNSLKANTLWGGIDRIDTEYGIAVCQYATKRYRESSATVDQILKKQPNYQEALQLRKLLKKVL